MNFFEVHEGDDLAVWLVRREATVHVNEPCEDKERLAESCDRNMSGPGIRTSNEALPLHDHPTHLQS